MMGLLMIDGVGWGAEWVDSVNEFYHLRMTLDSELQKSPAGRDTKRALAVDPPLRKSPPQIGADGSAVLDGRQGVVCVEDGERCVHRDFKLTVQIDGLCSSQTQLPMSSRRCERAGTRDCRPRASGSSAS